MASLNTLRTKFGFALTAIIALALLAFIFSMKDGLGFSNSEEPVVGTINSEEIMQSEYNTKYNDIKLREGVNQSTEQVTDQLSNAAWGELYVEKALIPAYEELGLNVTEEEYLAAVAGDAFTYSLYSRFGDVQSRAYSSAAVASAIGYAEQNPEAARVWDLVRNRAYQDRAMIKYNTLLQTGVYANALELAEGVKGANNTYSGKYVSMPYTSMADSLFEVSPAEIEAFYNAHKAQYKQSPSRTISYVSFDFEATPEDILDIEAQAKATAEKFEQAENVLTFARTDAHTSVPATYLAESQIDAEELETLAKGEMYGPLKKNNVWRASRVASAISAPDSVGMRWIVLPQGQAAAADSLVNLAKGDADFAELAMANSYDQQSAQNGGDMGVLPFAYIPRELAEAIAPAKQDDIVKVDFNGNTFILDLYRLDSKSKYYSVAAVEYPVEASQATIESQYSEAGKFLSEAAGSLEAFKSAADSRATVARTAQITSGQRTVNGIENSRDIARWAFRATPGSISEVFTTPTGYVVAMVAGVDDSQTMPLALVSSRIKSQLLNDKKFEAMSAKFKGATIEEMAAALDVEVQEFSNIKGSANYAPGMPEPRVIGAIANTKQNTLSAPIKGRMQAYVVEVTDVESTEDQTVDAERLRVESMARERVGQMVDAAIYDMMDVDNKLDLFF